MSARMGNHRAAKRNLDFVKPQILLMQYLSVSNISKEVLLGASKKETKIRSEDCVPRGVQLFTLPLRKKG